MSLYRRLLLIVLPALLMFVGVVPAAAAPVTSSASFTIPAGQCASLPPDITVYGEGVNETVSNTKTMPDGTVVTNTNTVIKGNAWDDKGGTYKFIYQNASADTLMSDGTHSIRMSDTFVMTGSGTQLTVGFNWGWTYSTPEEVWPPVNDLVQTSTRNDPLTCDPL